MALMTEGVDENGKASEAEMWLLMMISKIEFGGGINVFLYPQMSDARHCVWQLWYDAWDKVVSTSSSQSQEFGGCNAPVTVATAEDCWRWAQQQTAAIPPERCSGRPLWGATVQNTRLMGLSRMLFRHTLLTTQLALLASNHD